MLDSARDFCYEHNFDNIDFVVSPITVCFG